MFIRLFTQRAASAIQPGDAIDTPRPMLIDEVHNTLEGMKLIGRRLGHSEGRRYSAMVQQADVVECPILDADDVMRTLADAFTALTRQQADDEVPADSPERFEWQMTQEGDLAILSRGAWLRLRLVDEITRKPEPESNGSETVEAEPAATKRKARRKPKDEAASADAASEG